MIKKTDPVFMFICVYVFTFMCGSIYGSFVPLYLGGIGFGNTEIGLLLSLPPLVAVVGQPLWGVLSDRAAYKNTILAILIFGSGVTFFLFGLSVEFWLITGGMVLFTFFQSSIGPITDTILLEYLKTNAGDFGKVRLAGTLGFSAMSLMAGYILQLKISYMFSLYFFVSMLALVCVFALPKIKGHPQEKNSAPISLLFQNKTLMLKFTFVFIIYFTLGFYSSFYGLFVQQLGGNSQIVGIANFLAGMSEVPFLLFSAWVFRKVKLNKLLLMGGIFTAIRWFLTGLATSHITALAVQPLHGVAYIVLAVSMAMYINRTVPDELQASGQSFHALLLTVSKIMSSLLGGRLSDTIGIRGVFLIMAAIAILDVVVFAYIFHKEDTLDQV